MPLAAIDDIIGVVVFFTTVSIISGIHGGVSTSPLAIIGIVLFPFIIGIFLGLIASLIIKHCMNKIILFSFFLGFLILSAISGLLVDYFVFHSFSLNYLLIGMAFCITIANLVPKEKLNKVMEIYNPILNIFLIIVIVNLGMPLDYRLIAGAGLFTFIYIFSRAMGKIGCAYLGGKITKAPPMVTKYLGFTLLPHSGVSLVFTGIAVIIAKYAFKWAKEIEAN